MKQRSRAQYLLRELGDHIPFSIFGVSLSLVSMGILTFLAVLLQANAFLPQASHDLFHVFHPIHLLFSATATTAMFWKHEKNFIKAIIVGTIGSLAVCGLSDILFPFLGGLMLGADMHIHVCVLENPLLIATFIATGIIAGVLVPHAIEHATEYSHAVHVFISSAASILYLLAYGVTEWIHSLGSIFLIMTLAVLVPCCLSDIIFPLFCAHKGCGCDKDDCCL